MMGFVVHKLVRMVDYKYFSVASALLAVPHVVACAGPRMVPPADLAQGSDVLSVQNRSSASGAFVNESFDLGRFKVQKVDRDWGKNSSLGIGGYSASQTKTGYSFELAASSTWLGACSSLSSEKGAGGFSFGGKSQLVCECKQGEQSATAKLEGSDVKNHTSGELNWGERKLKLAAVTDTDMTNLTGGPAGYRADEEDKLLGAVEVLRPGQVWLSEGLDAPTGEALSCVFAGFMLYQPPSDM
jgi:hypothetical protein